MKKKRFELLKGLLVCSLFLTNVVFLPKNIFANNEVVKEESEEVEPNMMVPSDPGGGGSITNYRTLGSGYRSVTITQRITDFTDIENVEIYTETISYMDNEELDYFLRHCLIEDTEDAMYGAYKDLARDAIVETISVNKGTAVTFFAFLISFLTLGTTISTEQFYTKAIEIADEGGNAIITLRDSYKHVKEWTDNIYSYKNGTLNDIEYEVEAIQYK